MVLISCLSTYLSEPLGNYWGMILEQFGDFVDVIHPSALLAFPTLFNVFPSCSLSSALFYWEREPPCSASIFEGASIQFSFEASTDHKFYLLELECSIDMIKELLQQDIGRKCLKIATAVFSMIVKRRIGK